MTIPEGTLYVVSGDEANAVFARMLRWAATGTFVPVPLWMDFERLVKEKRIAVITNIGNGEESSDG